MKESYTGEKAVVAELDEEDGWLCESKHACCNSDNPSVFSGASYA